MGRSDGGRRANRIDRGPVGTLPWAAIHAAALSCALVALGGSPARAGDGVVEISQTCATQTGCMIGDTAGYPVTLNARGSYRLTSDLVVPDANTSGLNVTIDDVTIDLGGFAIRGPVVCTGTPLACTPGAGTGTGIQALSFRVTVRDGKIAGMGLHGMQLGEDAQVSHVIASSNRGGGVITSQGSQVSDCIASDNGSTGFGLNGAGSLRDSAATGNLGLGVQVGANGVVRDNLVTGNGSNGITAGNGATVVGNSVRDNGGNGISTSNTAIVADNSVHSNDGIGISVGPGSIVRANAIGSNTSLGLSVAGGIGVGYVDNVFNGNLGGSIAGGTNLGSNLCNGSTTCP